MFIMSPSLGCILPENPGLPQLILFGRWIGSDPVGDDIARQGVFFFCSGRQHLDQDIPTPIAFQGQGFCLVIISHSFSLCGAPPQNTTMNFDSVVCTCEVGRPTRYTLKEFETMN